VFGKFKEDTMPIRDAYQERVQARIESLYDSMEHHETHLQSTESVSMESHLEALRALKRKRGHLDGLLHDLKEAGEHGWEHLREHIDPAIDELKHAVEHARERLHGEK
jgi:ABC-type phosphate transport system auxiliary subunit